MASVQDTPKPLDRIRCPPLAPAEAAALARCFLLDRLEQLGEVSDGDALVAFAPKERHAEMRDLVPAGIRLVPQEGADLGARLDRLRRGRGSL